MSRQELPPLTVVAGHQQDVLVPGYIVVSTGFRFGRPTLMQHGHGSQMGIDAWGVGAFLAGHTALEDAAEDHEVTTVQLLILAAFRAGMEWQRDRRRRARISEATTKEPPP